MARLRDYRKFISSGYGLWELSLTYFRLMVWSRLTSALKHRFAERGRGVVIDHTAVVQGARFIAIGEEAWLGRSAWLTVPLIEMPAAPDHPILRIGPRVQVGPRCVISAVNDVAVEEDVLFGPNVYMADHIHAYRDVTRPIKDQGLSTPGRLRVGKGAWIGINAVIIANGKEVVIGEGAVVSANSVVTRSVPAHSVVAGAPARVIDQYDEATLSWRRAGTAGD